MLKQGKKVEMGVIREVEQDVIEDQIANDNVVMASEVVGLVEEGLNNAPSILEQQHPLIVSFMYIT